MKTSILLNKIAIVMLILILVLMVNSVKSNASELDSIADGANSFLQKGRSSGLSTMNSSGIKEASDTIYNILLGAGILIVLVIGSVLGIKFMLSSAEDKAKLKEALIPYIVGSIIIFGAFGIWKIVITLGRNFDNTSNSSGVTTSIEEEQEEQFDGSYRRSSGGEIHSGTGRDF